MKNLFYRQQKIKNRKVYLAFGERNFEKPPEPRYETTKSPEQKLTPEQQEQVLAKKVKTGTVRLGGLMENIPMGNQEAKNQKTNMFWFAYIVVINKKCNWMFQTILPMIAKEIP